MLTKNDLQQIQKVVQTETRKIVSEELEPVKKDVGSLKTDVSSLKKDMRYVKKTINVMVGRFDKEDVHLTRRIEKIEKHVGFPHP